MIRVRKPPAPAELSEGVAQMAWDCEDCDASEDAYGRGEKRFDFRGNIYGHADLALLSGRLFAPNLCASRPPSDARPYRRLASAKGVWHEQP